MQARECGFSAAAVRGARLRLKVRIRKEGFGDEGRWCWSLGRRAEPERSESGQIAETDLNGKRLEQPADAVQSEIGFPQSRRDEATLWRNREPNGVSPQ